MYQMTTPDTLDPILPIRKLAAGILEIAISDALGKFSGMSGYYYYNKDLLKAEHAAKALEWVNSDRSAEEFGSFLFCCEVLNFDPQAVRSRINSGNYKRVQRSVRGND